MRNAVQTYDCTLRDGEQCEGIALSLEDKLRIVERLDAFGIDVIEGGFPASNPKDIAFFQRVRQMELSHARIAAFGSTCKKGAAAAEDAGLRALVESGAPVLTIVGKAWDAQVLQVLQTTLDENLRMIADSVAFLKSAGRTVVFDAEHFFDGYGANADYALACVRAAVEAGVDAVALCDTNGGSLPSGIAAVVRAVADAFPRVSIGIHCHNDSGCAVANTLTAVEAGATQVQGTVNGLGERTGNADLLTVIADLELKAGVTCVGAEKLRELTGVAQFVADSCNMSLPAHQPYVGDAAFAHKAGLHASANMRMEHAYEHADPAAVGNMSHMVVSELASRAQLIDKMRALGILSAAQAARLMDDKANVSEDACLAGEMAAEEACVLAEPLCPTSDEIRAILAEVKQRENEGYSYEVADGSLAVLILRHLGSYHPHFTLESFRVIVDDHEDTGALAKDAMSEATIKIHVGEQRFVATGEGTGPVGALDSALRLAITQFFPQVASMELVDYKVRILDENVGTGAITRVLITTRDARGTWGTVGVSENIIEASWNALVDSIEFGLLRCGGC